MLLKHLLLGLGELLRVYYGRKILNTCHNQTQGEGRGAEFRGSLDSTTTSLSPFYVQDTFLVGILVLKADLANKDSTKEGKPPLFLMTLDKSFWCSLFLLEFPADISNSINQTELISILPTSHHTH